MHQTVYSEGTISELCSKLPSSLQLQLHDGGGRHRIKGLSKWPARGKHQP